MNSRFSGLIPELQEPASALVDVAKQYGLNPRVTSVRRSRAQQQVLYDRYRAGLQPYPVAPPGRSEHEYGLAFDMVTDNNEWLGRVWNSWGGKWGGPGDPVHFGVNLG